MSDGDSCRSTDSEPRTRDSSGKKERMRDLPLSGFQLSTATGLCSPRATVWPAVNNRNRLGLVAIKICLRRLSCAPCCTRSCGKSPLIVLPLLIIKYVSRYVAAPLALVKWLWDPCNVHHLLHGWWCGGTVALGIGCAAKEDASWHLLLLVWIMLAKFSEQKCWHCYWFSVFLTPYFENLSSSSNLLKNSIYFWS